MGKVSTDTHASGSWQVVVSGKVGVVLPGYWSSGVVCYLFFNWYRLLFRASLLENHILSMILSRLSGKLAAWFVLYITL